MNGYTRFGFMIVTSTIVMVALMYLNMYQLDHVFFSETPAYMALVMGATMAVIMLALMPTMHANRRAHRGILAVSIGVFILALWLVRSQVIVGDVTWMKAMIPHHCHRHSDQRTRAPRGSARAPDLPTASSRPSTERSTR